MEVTIHLPLFDIKVTFWYYTIYTKPCNEGAWNLGNKE